MTSETAIKVEPDSNGNVTITIKLVIKAVATTEVKEETNRSVILLDSDSNGSDDNNGANGADDNGDDGSDTSTVPELGCGLRSRIHVDDSSDESSDHELSQQVEGLRLRR